MVSLHCSHVSNGAPEPELVLPRRPSLVAQTAAALQAQIGSATWREWLPGERNLCEMLQISRSTLRAALKQLQRDGVIRAEHGAGNRIVAADVAPRNACPAPAEGVALLSAAPVEQLRPTQALWIDELRAMLSERGCRLRVFHGRQYFRGDPTPALAALVRQNRHRCWILTRSNEAVQRWFMESRTPCVVAGTTYPGIALPFRDLDHRAVCRHAASALLRLGHRRIALITHRDRCAGDLESELGFLEGAKPLGGGAAQIVAVDSDTQEVGHAVRRLMETRARPTALLVANAYHYLTVTTRLAQLGWRVPRDVSVISREDDPYLSFVLPTPARYAGNPHRFAKMLLRPVLQVMEGAAMGGAHARLMPEFVAGESIAACEPRAEAETWPGASWANETGACAALTART
jgi:LacI family transcriptional regulator